MRSVVQQFIEDNIRDIDTESYDHMFLMWYLYYAENRKDGDDLESLFKIFEKIGINLYIESEKIRENIIEDMMYECISNILIKDPNKDVIDFPEVVKCLNSKLGLSLLHLNLAFKVAASRISQTYDVSVQPFKIIRKH